jgi:hypothetical protein
VPIQAFGLNDDHRMTRAALHGNPGTAAHDPLLCAASSTTALLTSAPWPLSPGRKRPRFLLPFVTQRLLHDLSRVLVPQHNLLIARMKITAYDLHLRLLSPEPWSLNTPSLPGLRSRPDEIKQSEESLLRITERAFTRSSPTNPQYKNARPRRIARRRANGNRLNYSEGRRSTGFFA